MMEKINLKMRLYTTYKNIYDISEKMVKDGSGYLAMLLIGEVCRDMKKHPAIKKVFIQSGYVEKYKNIVINAIR